MLRFLGKALGYLKAPVKTFALLHPARFLKLAAVAWVFKKLFLDRGGSREEAAERPEAGGRQARHVGEAGPVGPAG